LKKSSSTLRVAATANFLVNDLWSFARR